MSFYLCIAQQTIKDVRANSDPQSRSHQSQSSIFFKWHCDQSSCRWRLYICRSSLSWRHITRQQLT